MKNKLFKQLCAVLLSVMMLITFAPAVHADSTATNAGLAEHCLRAYREDWTYVYGGTSNGYVDCSGLIATYKGVGGWRTDMLASCQNEGRAWGYVSNGVPNIHGLGLHTPGHVGVYVGSGKAVDARDVGIDVCYEDVYSRNWYGNYRWVEWFMITGVSYPYQGWVLVDGNSFYYEKGQYLTNTSRKLNGVTYKFNSLGVANSHPPKSAYAATRYSTVPDYSDIPHESTTTTTPTTTTTTTTTNLINRSFLNTKSIPLGKSVTVTCAASGGKKGYTYAVYYRKAGIEHWSAVQDYSTNAIVDIVPKASVDYEIRVAVKDSNGKIVRKDMTMTVEKPLRNTSCLNADSIRLGEKVKIRCFAENGQSPYTFSIQYKAPNSEKWLNFELNSTKNLFLMQPSSVGVYTIRVTAKSPDKQSARKDLTLNVTA